MIIRVLTSIALVIIFALLLISPPIIFKLAILLISIIAVYEILQAVKSKKALSIISIAISMLVFISSQSGFLLQGILLGFLLYLLASVFLFNKIKITNLYTIGFMNIILSLSFLSLANLRTEYDISLVILPFVFAWVTDTGAYFSGYLFGKHKLAPTLSPKKTIEGSIGGIILTVLCTILYAFICNKISAECAVASCGYIKLIPISLIGSIISQFGDLSLSAIKREFNVKDYGNLLPGHGGILDRFDSLIFVAPFVYYIFTI